MTEKTKGGPGWTARVTALGLVAVAYLGARLPEPSAAAQREASRRFAFVRHAIASPAGPAVDSARRVRAVHPSLQRLVSWISSVGAGIALADLDGDGLPNDVCYVDTRTDQVVVAPAPRDAGRRPYGPFVLDPSPLRYDRTMAPMGCLPGDLDEDGSTDLLVYYWGRTPIAFLHDAVPDAPLAEARFRPQELLASEERWFSNAAARADVDGDGHLDVVVGNYFPDGARVLDAHGDPNDVQQMQDSMSRAFNGGRDRILLCRPESVGGRRSVGCRDASSALAGHVANGWTLALGLADLDADHRPELYLAHDFGPDRLLHNRSRPGEVALALLEGARTLTTPASKVLGRDSFKGMGVDFGDVNHDGLLDIYVSNIAGSFSLEESNFLFVSQPHRWGSLAAGVAPYADHSEPLGLARHGWGWEARLADFDNDGALEAVQAAGFVKGAVSRWPELHELAMANDTLLKHPGSWFRLQEGEDLSGDHRSAFFVRDERGVFRNQAASVGLVSDEVSRGIATADVDGDGDLDLAVANQWAAPDFYYNDAPAAGRFLALRLLLPLEGAAETRVLPGPVAAPGKALAAIGATVKAEVHHPPTATRRRVIAHVDGGNGHSGKRSPEIHLGLGDWPADRHVPVEVSWRDARGEPRRQLLSLRPGWHTVLLASGPSEEDGL